MSNNFFNYQTSPNPYESESDDSSSRRSGNFAHSTYFLTGDNYCQTALSRSSHHSSDYITSQPANFEDSDLFSQNRMPVDNHNCSAPDSFTIGPISLSDSYTPAVPRTILPPLHTYMLSQSQGSFRIVESSPTPRPPDVISASAGPRRSYERSSSESSSEGDGNLSRFHCPSRDNCKLYQQQPPFPGFQRKSDLNRHAKEVHSNRSRSHLCRYCGKAYKRREHLAGHQSSQKACLGRRGSEVNFNSNRTVTVY